MLSRPVTYLGGVSSRSNMARRMSKTRFQKVGLGTSPCQVPRVAEKDSTSHEKDACAPGWHTPANPCLIHVLRAWLDYITMTPFMSISANLCVMSCGTPALCHTIRIRFLDTELKALCMPHVSLCRDSLYSIASSRRLRCCNIAVYVSLCALSRVVRQLRCHICARLPVVSAERTRSVSCVVLLRG